MTDTRTAAEQAAVTEYETAIAGIPDCFDTFTADSIRDLATYAAGISSQTVAAAADEFVRAHLEMLSSWHDALDALDSEIRADVVEGALPDWARQCLKVEALRLFDATTDLQRAVCEYHHGSAGPRLDPEYGHAYALSNSTLNPFK